MVGVGNKPGGATTHSLVMRSHSGAIRSITSEHALWKLSAYSAVKYNSPEGIDPETSALRSPSAETLHPAKRSTFCARPVTVGCRVSGPRPQAPRRQTG
jgi:hypothetical protein